MKRPHPQHIQNVYLTLTLLNTLAASFIWGINTLFLLNAGLSNTQAFLANAFFTVGQVLFEIPTGIVADTKGRRTSYLLGTVTLAISTLLYLGAWYVQAPMVVWAISSILLGLGFTFFSGATEAWLVDALEYAHFKGSLESVFGKAQMMSGGAMLVGAVSGGVIAQTTNISVPYILRAILLLITFVVAFVYMKDWGFESSQETNFIKAFRALFVTSAKFGWQNPAVGWLMLSAPLISGVGFYAFYAMQPFLLELYGDEKAYAVAGIAAAIMAGSQIAGGASIPYLKNLFQRRTTMLLTTLVLSSIVLALIGLATNFWLAIGLLSIWGLVSAAAQPVRQTFLNGLISSKQRATVLSFDAMMGSGGGVLLQPLLGKSADIFSYATSFMIGAVIQSISLPFIWLVRRQNSKSDNIA